MEVLIVNGGSDPTRMRWDLLESHVTTGDRLTVRLAVPNLCEDVLIGIDASRRRFVLIRIPDNEPCSISERPSRGIEVRTVEMKVDELGKLATFVEISCLDSDGHAALDIVTLEIVEALSAGSSIYRLRLVLGVLTKWKRFWSGVGKNLLSRERHLGLFGELWFLSNWLIPCVGMESGVAMWRGPMGARNDFETGGWALEVKTSSRLDGVHQIHGLEQLLEPPGVNLFLFSLLVRDEASGIESLPKLVAEIRTAMKKDHVALSQFDVALAIVGYDDAHAVDYGKLKFRIRAQALYRVGQDFPRLTPSSITAGLPVGVSNITYDLRLDAASRWLVADSPGSASEYLQSISTNT